ncbi:acyltransferase [Williamsia sp.]|uniref:acyltransferase family protein n=1 Tax=Williamsia sp. TaxID=1872085 RepID=UPI001A1979BE|nr:acyltransferase [Williamsia sp.]MBJ7291656.1 acyltransferase [Williamsia sp.]
MNLGQFFDIRANSLNSLRLLFATVVIVSHSWPVAGVSGEPYLGDMNYGEIAVAGFFAISGFLITGSRLNNDLVSYSRARLLRIFPGFWVCLAVSAFVAAPIAATVRGGWTVADALGYVYSNVTLVIRQWTIGGTLDGAPRTDSWNGPVWTLMYEFSCYILIGALFTIPRLRSRWVVLTAFAFFTLGCVAVKLGVLPDTGLGAKMENATQFGALFFAGAVTFMFRDRIPASTFVFVGALFISVASIAANWGDVIAPLGVAYLCIWISARFPRLLVERIGDGSIDISYGMYVYGWAVQQLVVLATLDQYGIGVMIAASVIGTVPIATLSWFAIEKPALRFKNTRQPVEVRETMGSETRTEADGLERRART